MAASQGMCYNRSINKRPRIATNNRGLRQEFDSMSTSNDTPIPEGYKRCTRCKDIKFKDAFYNHKRMPDGLSPRCKSCHFIRDKPRIDVPDGFKHCSCGDKCLNPMGSILPASKEYFTKDRTRNDGLNHICKMCAKEKDRLQHLANLEHERMRSSLWKKLNADRVREYSRTLYRNNEQRRRIILQHNRIRRSRKQSLPTTLTVEQFNIALEYFNGCCAYCGKTPSLFDRYYLLHADHFVPVAKGGGYTPDNIIPACQNCNLSKHDFIAHEWLIKRFGEHRAAKIENRIMIYFDWVKERIAND